MTEWVGMPSAPRVAPSILSASNTNHSPILEGVWGTQPSLSWGRGGRFPQNCVSAAPQIQTLDTFNLFAKNCSQYS